MINIEYPLNTTYWILTNGSVFIKGITEIDQVTSANDNWSVHLLTQNELEWQNECVSLNIWDN